MRYREALTISIHLDRAGGTPLATQIADQVTAAVSSGRMVTGTRLPSTRTLAELLGVSRGVAIAAYGQLLDRGTMVGHERSGTYVSGRVSAVNPLRTESSNCLDLRPGQIDNNAVPVAAWRAAWRQATLRLPPSQCGPAHGIPELKAAIADHLRRTRGLTLDRHEVIVTTGLSHGLRLVLNLFGEPAVMPEVMPPLVRRIAPHATVWPADRWVSTPAGCQTVVLNADAIPLSGQSLSSADRHAAASWSVKTGGYLVELACDAVFRPAVRKLPNLLDLAPSRVALIGDFGQLFTPAIGIGYAVVPAYLSTQASAYLEPPAYVPQRALACLLETGAATRVMHRLTHAYADKENRVRSCLTALGPAVRVIGFEVTATVALRLPEGVDASAVATQLAERGVLVSTLDPYYLDGQTPPGLAIGYGHLPHSSIDTAMATVVDVLNRGRRW